MNTIVTPSLATVIAVEQNIHKATAPEKVPSLIRTLRLRGAEGGKGYLGWVGAEGEGGYLTRSDVNEVVPGTTRTIDGQPLSEIWTEMNTRLSAFNATARALVSFLTFPVDRATDRVAVYETPKFEDASEFGRPSKVRLRYITRGFPLTYHDLGLGYTRMFLDSARSAEIQSLIRKVEAAWEDLRMATVLNALFDDTNATDEDGVAVKRLYNADSEYIPEYKRWTHTPASHTHYLTSGNTSPTAANLDTMEEHLFHHGYGDNGETLVLHAHRDEMPAIRLLTGFVPAESSTVPAILAGPVRGAERGAPGGLRVEGYLGRLVIVENNDIPSGYLFAHATGGSFVPENLIGLRQHENPSARGLRLVAGPVASHPLIDAVYDGYLGAGVRHRGAGVIMQVTAGAYAVPTF